MYQTFLLLLILTSSYAQEKIWPLHIIDGNGTGADGVRLADINGDKLMDVVTLQKRTE
ncbi:MAG: hypothetical protein NE328_24725 [Lentisphaeraceae bacterium]|nr:hypothetical protein [Lentisphaeraceae bacterium]